jgi:DNA-directed RNA polymerase specialized sigma24 family protein
MTKAFDEYQSGNRYAWIDTIDIPVLAVKLKVLPPDDLELLTLIVMDGYKQAEIARLRGCSKNAVSKKIIRIKRFLK